MFNKIPIGDPAHDIASPNASFNTVEEVLFKKMLLFQRNKAIFRIIIAILIITRNIKIVFRYTSNSFIFQQMNIKEIKFTIAIIKYVIIRPFLNLFKLTMSLCSFADVHVQLDYFEY